MRCFDESLWNHHRKTLLCLHARGGKRDWEVSFEAEDTQSWLDVLSPHTTTSFMATSIPRCVTCLRSAVRPVAALRLSRPAARVAAPRFLHAFAPSTPRAFEPPASRVHS